MASRRLSVLGIGGAILTLSCLGPSNQVLQTKRENITSQTRGFSSIQQWLAGVSAEHEGDFDLAISHFAQAIELADEPEGAGMLHAARGRVRARRGEMALAFDDLEIALKLSPRYGNYLERAAVYMDNGQFDRALEDYDTAIGLKPNDAILHNIRGAAFARIHRYDLAMADFETAMRLNPKYANAYARRGAVFGATNQHDRAFADFQVALQLENDNTLVYNHRGLLYASKGEYDSALEDFGAALRVDPYVQVAYLNRGAAYSQLGQFNRAVPDFVRAIELKPADSVAVLWLYLARTRNGQDAMWELQQNLRRLNLKNWPGPVADLYLGTAMNDTILRATEDTDPMLYKDKRCKAYFYLGQHALLKGNPPEAIRFFRAALDGGSPISIEYLGAREELKRLTQMNER